MNDPASSPQAARDRLAEKCGEFSRELAENGGGDWLSALLISIFANIIEALRSIAWPAQEAAIPATADGQKTPATPREKPEAPAQAEAALTAPARPRRPRNRKPPRKPNAGKAPAPTRKNPAATLSRNRRPGRQARRIAGSAGTTAPPRRPPKNRASAPTGFARP